MALPRIMPAISCLVSAWAQQPGLVTKEAPPEVSVQHCSSAGCVSESLAATLDSNWRWTHAVAGYVNCYTDGEWNSQLCPDPATCAADCAVEGVDAAGYEETYGVKPIDGGVELQFVASSGNVGSRLYLTDPSEEDDYKLFRLKNREFTVDVDVSSLACGLNGAVYFVEMDVGGGKGVGGNAAGAKYGTGYCDAQCPHDIKWMDGEANLEGKFGMCCTEMDIWEANREASAYTAHSCDTVGAERCEGVACGDGAAGERYAGVCDKDGCDHQSWRLGVHDFFGAGPGFAVDSTKPMTVVTQFVTSDGTDDGDLVDIKQFYVQEGKVITLPKSTFPGIPGNSITDDFCDAQKEAFGDTNDFKKKGGLKQMGDALDRGMVLVLSLWDDAATNMRWLDSSFPPSANVSQAGVERGPCDGEHESPEYVRSKFPSASVKYTNIMYGEIGSTTSGGARRLNSLVV